MELKSISNLARTTLKQDTYRKIGKTNFLFCSPDESKQDIISKKHVDRFLDPLKAELVELGYSCHSLAWPYSEITGNKTLNYTYSFNRLFAYREFVANFKSRVRIYSKSIVESRKETFRKVLLTTTPKAVFGINLPPQFCEIARELGINTIEVLHGFGYGKVFDSWNILSPHQLPTEIIAFDKGSASVFSDFGAGIYNVFQLDYEKNDTFLQRLARLTDIHKLHNDEKLNVLYTLQWGYDGDEEEGELEPIRLPNGLIPASILQAIEMTEKTVTWHFRLHPKQKTRAYKPQRKRLGDLLSQFRNVEWKLASDEPLPIVLSRVTHHISMSSMTAYQAAKEGIPSLLLDPRLQKNELHENYFTELRDSNILTTGQKSALEILDWLKIATRTQPLKPALTENVLSLNQLVRQISLNKNNLESTSANH